MNPDELRRDILEKLSSVIDPETGVDVIRMGLIEDLEVDKNGCAAYKFRPSSPFCPLAVPLSVDIKRAVASVKGVNEQTMEIVGFEWSDELSDLLNQVSEGKHDDKH